MCEPAKFNLGLTAFVAVHTTPAQRAMAAQVRRGRRFIPEIVEAYRMSGEIDYMLRIVANIAGYDAVYRKLIRSVELSDVSSSFAMERLKYSTALRWTTPEK